MKHYRINEIKTNIDEASDIIPAILSKRLKLRGEDIYAWEIRRRSIDARDKSDVHFVYAVDLWSNKTISNSAKPQRIRGLSVQLVNDADEQPEEIMLGEKKILGRPVIVGMGPCGIFAALELASRGYRPLVIERGPEMKDRIADVERFRSSGLLNPEGNMLYGEGGAGTFSDGKIGTGIKDGNIRKVLKQFAEAGAGEDILYLNKPHIGTDVLRTVIVNLRNRIIELGGEVSFNTRLDSLYIENGELKAIKITKNTGAGISCERDTSELLETNAMILAIGHSARDSFRMIKDAGLELQQKPFSIGVRMEHPQALIDSAQYGDEAIKKYGRLLPPADYKLSTRTSKDRGVYSFCMCPGGEVVVCSTAEGELCVNGMSNRNRDSGTANSGILCDVRCEDYNNGDISDVLAGVRFQEKYERLAFINGGSDFTAPSCSMAEFVSGEGAAAKAVISSLPEFASDAIREAVPCFGKKIKGYDKPNAVITAVETRSSSPVKIVRDEVGQSNIIGIYPAGEGAGYAGGITSAACDGIRAAGHIMKRFKPD